MYSSNMGFGTLLDTKIMTGVHDFLESLHTLKPASGGKKQLEVLAPWQTLVLRNAVQNAVQTVSCWLVRSFEEACHGVCGRTRDAWAVQLYTDGVTAWVQILVLALLCEPCSGPGLQERIVLASQQRRAVGRGRHPCLGLASELLLAPGGATHGQARYGGLGNAHRQRIRPPVAAGPGRARHQEIEI